MRRDLLLGGIHFLATRGTRVALLALTGVLVGLTLGALVLAPAARAEHSVTEHVSQGVTGGNGAFSTSLRAASTDGSTVLLETSEQLVAADTDTQIDFYRRAGGITELATAGPMSTGPDFVNVTGMTPDGAAVFFYTRDALVAADTDSIDDAYMYRAGATTLLSPGPTACFSSQSYAYHWSDDGARVFIQSWDRLTAADTDCAADVYEYNAGTLTLVQPGPGEVNLVDVSADGGRVFFTTQASLLPADTDASSDIYRREGATLTLVSTGPAGGNGAFNASQNWVSPAGDRASFQTAEQLVAADTDSARDIYVWDEGTVTLASIGPAGGNDGTEASGYGASSDVSHLYLPHHRAARGRRHRCTVGHLRAFGRHDDACLHRSRGRKRSVRPALPPERSV